MLKNISNLGWTQSQGNLQ